LASGAGIVFLVPGDVLEMDVEDLSARELLATLALRSHRAVRCERCGRIAVERKGGAIEFFAKEPIKDL
jgi:hypothetical protein